MNSEFINPIGITNIGDPYILKASDNKYYLYATSFFKGFFVWVSDDLVNWSTPIPCYEANEKSFGYKDFWAPEVVEYKGKFIMHYSARWKQNNSLRIGVAISDNPTGPFIDVNDSPMFDFGFAAIDGHVFFDDDGQIYFYYSRDCSENVYENRNESHIYVIRLTEDLLNVYGEPILVAKPEKEWEISSGDWRWNEGPFIIKRNNLYYMLYSANFFASKYYSLGCAVSKSPLGPFEKYDAPVLSYVEGKVSGPGHNSIVVAPNGKDLVCAYHVHTFYNLPGENRQVFLDKIYFDKDVLKIQGPTID